MRRVRLSLVAALLVLLSACITVSPDPQAKRPTSKEAKESSSKPPTSHPSVKTPQKPVVSPEHSPSTKPSLQESPMPSKVVPPAPRPTKSAEPKLPTFLPCVALDSSDVRQVTLAFGDARSVASSANVDEWTVFSCTYGTAPGRQLKLSMALDTTSNYELWRLMVDSAKRAGNFSPFQDIGDKAFRGGEYDIAVRKGSMIVAFSNTGSQLKPATSKHLVASVFAALSR